MKIKQGVTTPVRIKQLSPVLDLTRKAEERERASFLRLLRDASRTHPWTFATVEAVARSVIGSGWQYIPVEGQESSATQKSLKQLVNFFEFRTRRWDNIKDFISLPDKMSQTIASYRLYGHAAWEIVRNANGLPIGFDVLSGVVIPLVDKNGYFKSPAFKLIPWDEKDDAIYYEVDEIVYFQNPGISGTIGGESMYEALSSTSLPADIYASVAYREIFKNSNAPYNGVWELDPSVSDEDFDAFAELLQSRYSGAGNFGRNPLVVRGTAKFNSYASRSKEDAPYLEGRAFNREEYYAVTGVDGNKLGISEEANKSNIRETRREFHENVLRPIFKKLEDSIYYQVNVRLFGAYGWRLQFNQPDITTALERTTMNMRDAQLGFYTINEIRERNGDKPREGGDFVYIPKNMALMYEDGTYFDPSNSNIGDDLPDDEAGDDTPNADDVRAPRDEENPDTMNALKELRLWRKYHLKALDGKKPMKDFITNSIPPSMSSAIKVDLSQAGENFDLVKMIFDRVERELQNE